MTTSSVFSSVSTPLIVFVLPVNVVVEHTAIGARGQEFHSQAGQIGHSDSIESMAGVANLLISCANIFHS